MAMVPLGRAALPDMTRPCLSESDSRSSQGTILAPTRLPRAANATETALAAAREWLGLRAGIGRSDTLHPDRAPQRPLLDHPAMRGGHPGCR